MRGTYGENVGSNGGVFTTSAARHLSVSGYADTSAGRITTSGDQTFGFSNKQELDLTNFLENVTHDERIDTVTTTSGPASTTVRRVSESYPLRMRSLFQVPEQGRKDFFRLPAGVEQSLIRNTTVTVNGVQTFASSLGDTVNASALLNRTNGAQGWITSDRLLPSC